MRRWQATRAAIIASGVLMCSPALADDTYELMLKGSGKGVGEVEFPFNFNLSWSVCKQEVRKTEKTLPRQVEMVAAGGKRVLVTFTSARCVRE